MIDYAATFINYTGAFPNTVAKNVTAPGAGDGTEFVAAMVNDIWGRAQALLQHAGLTPDGMQEAPGTAQILTALKKGFALGAGYRVMYDKNGTPAANGDRVLLLTGQVIDIASYQDLVDACYVGNANNATAPAYYKTSDAGGTTRSTAGAYMVLPDHRAVSPKGAGNQTINTRVKTGPAFGAVEEDAIQGHGTSIQIYTGASGVGSVSIQGVSASFSGSLSGQANVIATDGANGTPRVGATTRDCTIGTNFGITY